MAILTLDVSAKTRAFRPAKAEQMKVVGVSPEASWSDRPHEATKRLATTAEAMDQSDHLTNEMR